MQMAKILLFSILTSLCCSLDITFDLQSSSNLTQPSTIKNITLRPNQVFQYQSDYLEYSNVHIENCKNYRGSLLHDIVGQLPIRSNISNIQQAYTDSYGIIYLLEHQNLQAYNFSQSHRVVTYIDKVDFQNSHCGSQIVLSNDREYLYHFSCFKITKIQLKKSLSSIKVQLEFQEAFYGHKVLSGKGFFVWISYTQGVRIYQVINQTLMLQQTLQKFQNFDSIQKITDGVLRMNRLYLLGHESTLFIFDLLGNGTFQSKLNVSLKGLCMSCKHQQIVVSSSNIYIYSMQNREQFISELQLSAEQDKIFFVRYYKGHQNLITMEIWNQRLLTVSKHVMNLYESNRDPRTIGTQLNGISNNHLQPIIKMNRISDNLFMKVTASSIQLIKLVIKKPHIQCQKAQQSKFIVQVKQNCIQRKSSSKRFYWQSCITQDILQIVVQQEKKQRHVFAVASVFVFCLTVIGVLAIWRRSKIDLIEALVIEINKLRKNKGQQRIDFVQQKPVARQVNWSQISEQHGSSEKESRRDEKQHEHDSHQMQEQISQEHQQIQMQGTQRHMQVKK